MSHATHTSAEGSRISLDVDPPLHQRIAVAAAAHDQDIEQYILDAVKDRLLHESDDEREADSLNAATDPVLADVWNNARDADYDHL